MKTYEQVDSYMQEVGLKYIKGTNEFIAGLAYRTSKDYAMKIAEELNSRAHHENSSNMVFYKMKNEMLEGSVYISAAFDGGLFRHLGNMIIDNADIFKGLIIDYACDCGIVSCFIAKMYPEAKVIGVDVNSSAIENAKELAAKLGVENIEFVCSDVFEFSIEEKADTACSFRTLLDVCLGNTKNIPFFGEREWREKQYAEAFSDYARIISDNLKDGGNLVSVERYTADYGWLGWIEALEQNGLCSIEEKCEEMRAADLSSVKDYSVTFCNKNGEKGSALSTLCSVLGRNFKSGTGYDGYMAEFALYHDADGSIEFCDVYKEDKIMHQFAIADAKSGKIMYFDANGNYKKIKYANAKKRDVLERNLKSSLDLYSSDEFTVKKYTLQINPENQ